MRCSVVGTLVVAALAVTAGCGGGSASPTEAWAGDVCSSMDTWATQLQGYANDVQSAVSSPSADSVATIRSTIAKGADATNQMVASLKSLGPPPATSGSESARSAVDSFTAQIEQTLNEVRAQAQTLEGSNPAAMATALGMIATDVSAAIAEGKTTFQTLQNDGGEVKDAFTSVDSCKQLQKDFGD